MEVKFGNYNIKARELDNKLLIQFVSDLGKVSMVKNLELDNEFPNSITFKIENPTRMPEAKALKKISFGLYKFILGINYHGELVFFHSQKMNVGKKNIDGVDTLSLSLMKDPK